MVDTKNISGCSNCIMTDQACCRMCENEGRMSNCQQTGYHKDAKSFALNDILNRNFQELSQIDHLSFRKTTVGQTGLLEIINFLNKYAKATR